VVGGVWASGSAPFFLPQGDDEEKEDSKPKKDVKIVFQPKKWNAVVLWSYDIMIGQAIGLFPSFVFCWRGLVVQTLG
jgi:hypothetical protein